MNIRSFMCVTGEGDDTTLYVLVQGQVNDCAVYMKSGFDPEYVSWYDVLYVANQGAKVSIRDVDALPFKIPSDLEYRA